MVYSSLERTHFYNLWRMVRVCSSSEGPTMTTTQQPTPMKTTFSTGAVHCPICTHSVAADLAQQGRRMFIKPGQKCPRCSSTLDAAYILGIDRAA